MFVYSPDFTRQSKLAPAFLAELNELCERDYEKSYFPMPIVCLDLDAYEKSCTGKDDATMDAATGLADWQDNHSASDRHLLVELRLGYRSASNFDLGNMKRKVIHSRDILVPERINRQVVFLYEPNVAALAKNYFNRLARQDHEVKSWVAMDVEGFSNYIIDRSTLPYQPENNLEAIETDLRKKHDVGGFNDVVALVEYWITQMEQYNLRYKQAESNAIAEVILRFMETLTFANDSFEYEYLSVLKDDVCTFVNKK